MECQDVCTVKVCGFQQKTKTTIGYLSPLPVPGSTVISPDDEIKIRYRSLLWCIFKRCAMCTMHFVFCSAWSYFIVTARSVAEPSSSATANGPILTNWSRSEEITMLLWSDLLPVLLCCCRKLVLSTFTEI